MPVRKTAKTRSESTPLATLLLSEMRRAGIRNYAELSEISGVPSTSLSRWIRGRRRPQVDRLSTIAQALRPDAAAQRALLGELASAVRTPAASPAGASPG
jgi:transcriptional regulator with XRE-family HTH domain